MSNNKPDPEPKVFVYIPKNAKINVENKNDDPPVPKYNNRKKIIDLDAVKKIVGGKYGKNED